MKEVSRFHLFSGTQQCLVWQKWDEWAGLRLTEAPFVRRY